MSRLGRCATVLVVLLTAVQVTPGAIVAFWQPVPISPAAIADDPQLATMQTWDLMVTTDGNWTFAGMRAVLPPANFYYKHPLAGNFMPNRSLIAAFPALEFTTYVTFPVPDFGPTPPALGGWPVGQPPSLGDSTATIPGTFSLTWGDLVFDAPGTYQIARLTFPQNVFPNVINIEDVGPQGQFSRTSQVSPDSTTEIPDIPEPVGWSIFGVLAFRLAGRRPTRRDLR